MPQSIPKAAVLLEAAVKYLETGLMPTLDGYHRFQTRVTVNVLNTVRRELELRGAQAEAERSRLADQLEQALAAVAAGEAAVVDVHVLAGEDPGTSAKPQP